jgi:hypothetical protein
MRRRPWLVAVAFLLGACAMTEDSRGTAFLKDARECEMDADAQLKTVSQADQGSGCYSCSPVWRCAAGPSSRAAPEGP